MRHFEDYVVGEVERFGRYAVTREEVLAFARAFDPQPFHLSDEGGAANPVFGRLAASGWHTAAMAMRMLVDHMEASGAASLGSPGIDELRWLRPVYPGDVLRMETEVIGKSESRSRPTIGFVRTRTTVFNQQGEAVMTQIASNMQRKRG